jgi:hypothetical protein
MLLQIVGKLHSTNFVKEYRPNINNNNGNIK